MEIEFVEASDEDRKKTKALGFFVSLVSCVSWIQINQAGLDQRNHTKRTAEFSQAEVR